MSDSPSSGLQTHAIIVAAGRGERAGLDRPKQFETVSGKALVRHSVEAFLSHDAIKELWVVVAADQGELIETALTNLSDFHIVVGGDTRQQSVAAGLAAIQSTGGCKNVLVHDAARPFLTGTIIDRLLCGIEVNDAVIPVLPTIDTTIALQGGFLDTAVDRDNLWRVQTPQAFDFEKLVAAHENYRKDGNASDDSQIFKAAGHAVSTVEGDERLAKFTTPEDFRTSGASNMSQTRTGMGYDVHRLAEGEELWLGGIKIEHDKGLAGHSDADVLLHALTDALLGAIGAGDIGDHFPPSDPQWKGAASRKFVEHAVQLIAAKGGRINNVDMTLICEVPKIKPHRGEICKNVAEILELSPERVSVKATTTEGLGFAGRKEGIAAQAIATITTEAL